MQEEPFDWVRGRVWIGSFDQCFYCRQPAWCGDHAIPWSYLSNGTSGKWDRGIFVWACRDCNARLSSLFFDTLAERCAYVNNAIRHKNERLLRLPQWKPRDLRELGPNLRSLIQRYLKSKSVAVRRVVWQNSSDFFNEWNRMFNRVTECQPTNCHLHRFLMPPWERIRMQSPSAGWVLACRKESVNPTEPTALIA
jgi:hypothetical protein